MGSFFDAGSPMHFIRHSLCLFLALSAAVAFVACGSESTPKYAEPIDRDASDGGGDGSNDPDGGSGCRPLTCAELSRLGAPACDLNDDGCGGTIDCSTCEGITRVCVRDDYGIGRCLHRGEVDGCQPRSREEACGAGTCGHVSDGCAGTIDCGGCGSGEHCSAGTCGPTECIPQAAEVLCAGKCGTLSDGCGGKIECSEANGGTSCSFFDYCGFGGVPNECGCTPNSRCDELGYECGFAPDGCGGSLDCWPAGGECPEGEICTGQPSVCAPINPADLCIGPLCDSIPWDCPEASPTRLTGFLTTPDGELRVPNAVVYIPRDPDAPLPQLSEGVVDDDSGASCERCENQNAELGPVLAGAVTDHEGRFTLEGYIPVDREFLLVAKTGKWRSVARVPAGVTSACGEVDLANTYSRLPGKKSDGEPGSHLPKIAVSTGRIDAMECVLLKMGIDLSEFTSVDGDGRVHLYRSPYENSTATGGGKLCNTALINDGTCPGSDISVDSKQLTDANTANGDLFDYDLVLWDCEAATVERGEAERLRVKRYADRGGRFFASHWAHDWLHHSDTYGSVSDWGDGAGADFDHVYLSFSRPRANPPRLQRYARWLEVHGALDYTREAGGELVFARLDDVSQPRNLGGTVSEGVDEWIFRTTNSTESEDGTGSWPPSSNTSVQQFSFNTPLGANAEEACGRIAFSGFHVAGADEELDTSDQYFPAYCPGDDTLTAQEKTLAYMIFDLASCISEDGGSEAPICTPLTPEEACAGANECGQRPDGCGGIIECGDCTCTPPSCSDGDTQFCGSRVYHPDCPPVNCGGCPEGLICYASNVCGPHYGGPG